ncbi:MAG: 3-hydroxyacyl-CoA dehydrogenase family protein [Bilifractor sp.]|jgi:3-hydroxybutyryl-CoA dehydrogenase
MTVRKIGIAGAGTMGYSMADIFAANDYEVVLWNHREPKLERARQMISESSRDRILYTTSMEKLSSCDLIVENVAENLKIKTDFYDRLSEIVSDETVIATNTSGLSINTLSEHVKHRERFLGMHWFNPPTLILLIEIIKNDETSDEAAQCVRDVALHIGKKPVIVNRDVYGFAANRLQMAVIREALSLVRDGVVSREGIDDVMKYGLGFRWACIGPLETMDFGGLDIFYHISEYLCPDLEDSHDVPELLREHFNKGEFGVKSGRGFYDYSGGKDAAATRERDEKLRKVYQALYGPDETREKSGE